MKQLIKRRENKHNQNGTEQGTLPITAWCA